MVVPPFPFPPYKLAMGVKLVQSLSNCVGIHFHKVETSLCLSFGDILGCLETSWVVLQSIFRDYSYIQT